jgi:hypothetical protein
LIAPVAINKLGVFVPDGFSPAKNQPELYSIIIRGALFDVFALKICPAEVLFFCTLAKNDPWDWLYHDEKFAPVITHESAFLVA